MNQSKPLTIVMLGAGATGKSSITVIKVSGHFLNIYDPTIEDSYRTAICVDGEVVSCDILDTAGQEEYLALRDSYIRSGQCFIMVCSLVSKNTLLELDNILDSMKMILDITDFDNIPIVIAANKCDLTTEIQIQDDELRAISESRHIPYYKCTAKNNINIDILFEYVIKRFKELKAAEPAVVETPMKDKKKRKCNLL